MIISQSASSVDSAVDDLPDGVKKVTEVEGITEYVLSNGVQVLLFPDNSKPQFTINVTVLVGSRHEGYGETGMAHLLEHMLFKGTTKYDDIPALLKDRGVLNMNGTTSYDRTNYYETLPATKENLEFAIDMEADRLVNSLIRAEDLASEMTVVRSEFERGENSPQAILFQRIMATAYEWHNYGKTTIGNRTDIMRVPVGNLRDFYRKFYQPDNIMVVLAGKFEPARALKLLDSAFGQLDLPNRELPKTYTEEPPQDGERTVVLRRVGDIQLVGVGYHVMSAADPDYAAAQVLGEILSTEPSGPLYQELVTKDVASNTGAFVIAGHDPGMMLATAQVSVDGDLVQARKMLTETIENLSSDYINDDSVSRAINKLKKQREQQFSNTERFALNLSEWRAYGDWRLYFLHRDRLEKVTSDDVMRVAKTYLLESNRTVGLFEPTKEPIRAKTPSRPNLDQALAGYVGREKISEGEAFEPTPDAIEKRTTRGTLESGISFAMLPKKTRGEIVYLAGEINYGNSEDLKGKTSATELLPRLLSRGTSQFSFQEFKDRLDELSASLSFGGRRGDLTFNIQAKRDTILEVIDLLNQALRKPLLNEEDLDVIKRRMITQMESAKSDPQGLAGNTFQRKLSPHSPDDVRYVPTIDESIERVASVTIDDVRDLHSRFLNGKHGNIAVVGEFDPDALSLKLNEVFNNWDSNVDYRRIENPAPDNLDGERIVINTPDKKNAIYLAGTNFQMDDTAPEYEPMLIGNYVLGGGPLASRLADRVRKKDGLSYGVGSQFRASSEDLNSTLLMFAISNPTNTEKVVQAIDEELTRFLESGVTAEELDKAKESFLKTRQGRRAEDRGLARLLLNNLKNDRTMEFQKESDRRIEELTKQAVDDSFKQRFRKENLVIVTAGDFAESDNQESNEAESSADLQGQGSQ